MIVYAFAFLTLLMWSSAFVAIRYMGYSYDPLLIAALRLTVAGMIVLPYVIVKRSRLKIDLIDTVAIAMLGVLGLAIYNAGVMIGETTLDAGTASFIVAQTPVFSLVLAIFFLNERIFTRTVVGMILCLTGIIVIYLVTNSFNLKIDKGMLWILLAVISQSFYFVLQKNYIKKYSPLHVTLYSMLGAAIPAVIYLPFNFDGIMGINREDVAIIFYLSVFPSILAYYFWAKALQKLSAIQVTNTLYLLPILTIIQSWFFLDEFPLVGEVVGGLIGLAGVIVAQHGNIIYCKLFSKKHI